MLMVKLPPLEPIDEKENKYPNSQKVLNDIYKSTYRKGGSTEERRGIRITILMKAIYRAYRCGQLAERNFYRLSFGVSKKLEIDIGALFDFVRDFWKDKDI